MKHCKLLRLCLPYFIHNIKSEVKVFSILEFNLCWSSCPACLYIDPLLPYAGSFSFTLHLPGDRCIPHGIQFRNRCAGGVKDYSVKLTVFSPYCDHAMRNGRVEVTSVPWIKCRLMLSHLDEKLTGYTYIHFLSVMSGKLYIVVFSILIVFALYIQGFCNSPLK